MTEKTVDGNQIVFQPCQSDECKKIQLFIEEEVGEFDLNDLPIAFLKLFNIETALVLDSNQLLLSLLDDLKNSMGGLIEPNYQKSIFPQLEVRQAKGLLFNLLTEGTGGGANAVDNTDEARQLIEKLFDWCGEDCCFYTNYQREYLKPDSQYKEYCYPSGGGSGRSLFQADDYSAEEGLIFISSDRAGIFWFFGED